MDVVTESTGRFIAAGVFVVAAHVAATEGLMALWSGVAVIWMVAAIVAAYQEGKKQ